MSTPQFHPSPLHDAGSASKKKSKGPMILMILGGVILLLSIIVGIALTVVGVGSVAGSMSQMEELPTGTGTVTAEEGDVLQLYKLEDAGPVSCIVMGPDGSEPGEGTGQSSEIGDADETWVSFDSFEATASGDYEIACDDAPISVGPPLSMGGVFGALGGILGGIGGAVLGFLVLLAGLIWWFVGRKKTA